MYMNIQSVQGFPMRVLTPALEWVVNFHEFFQATVHPISVK